MLRCSRRVMRRHWRLAALRRRDGDVDASLQSFRFESSAASRSKATNTDSSKADRAALQLEMKLHILNLKRQPCA